MKYYILLIAVFLISCNPDSIENEILLEENTAVEEISLPIETYWYDDEIYSTILTEGEDQDVYKSYLTAFIADAKRHNVDLSHVDIENSLFELVDADVVAARASCDPFKSSIIWNKDAWLNRYPLNKTEEPYRIYIFWHEFGHDLLGLDHLCRSGHIMTGRHTECRGDGNEGDEINLYGLKYNTDEEVRDFRRAVDDMFGMVDQIYLGCRTSLTTKTPIGIESCNMNF